MVNLLLQSLEKTGSACAVTVKRSLLRAARHVQELFSSLSNGEIRKLAMTDLLNPFSAAWKNVRRARKVITDHNYKVRSNCIAAACQHLMA